MALALPSSLSPSKVSAFKSCPLAFRFSAIDKLPEPPSPQAVKGTLVHRALELFYWSRDPGRRTRDDAIADLRQAWHDLADDPEMVALDLSEEEASAFRTDAEALVLRYFDVEDPDSVRPLGLELVLEADIGPVLLRGIIDRLEVTPSGDLFVTDYKTGRSPSQSYQQARLDGVQIYAYLCAQVLGRAPAKVQLLYLRDGVAITANISEQTLASVEKKTLAIWSAIERACQNDDFRPRPSALCGWCNFKAFCPAFGGDPAMARAAAGAGTNGL
ncbi:MAG: PD-(D/E)XK nuclease family protein [Actinomycetota bacterium]|nr:PD-(D/E)XK nuclease family protein [Actinomycetota bacterium]